MMKLKQQNLPSLHYLRQQNLWSDRMTMTYAIAMVTDYQVYNTDRVVYNLLRVWLAEKGRLRVINSTKILKSLRKRYQMAIIRSLPWRTNALVRYFSKIVITNDGSTIVALHQQQEFPYNLSKPLPEEKEDKSLLKMSDITEVKRVFNDMKPEFARKQLASLTMTTEHRWFPRARDKRAKKTEMNRPYL